MVTSSQAPLAREAVAQMEVGHTDVGAGTVRFLLVFFLVSLVIVPLYELAGGRAAEDLVTPWSHLARIPAEASARVAAESTSADSGAWAHVVAGNRSRTNRGWEERCVRTRNPP